MAAGYAARLFPSACASANREERVSHHADVRFHPGVLVALNWNEHFRARKALLDWRRTVGLRLVPFLIELWCRVNVVLCRVAVGDLELLIDHNAEYVRRIVTTVLIELNLACWCGPGVLGNLFAAVDGAFLDVDEHVGELAVFNDGVVSC